MDIVRAPGSSRFFAIRGLVLFIFAMTGVQLSPASAQDGGIYVSGAGVVGAIIANGLANQGSDSRQYRRSSTTRTTYRRSSGRTRYVAQQKRRYVRKSQTVTEAATTSAPANVMTAAAVSPAAVAPLVTQPAAAAAPAKMSVISTQDEIVAAQQHLKFMGYDVPQANGVLDLKTKIAVMQFQDTVGKPTTGELTYDELQMLFRKVAAKNNRP